MKPCERELLEHPFLASLKPHHLSAVAAMAGEALLGRCEEDQEFGHALMKRMTQLLIRRLAAGRRLIVELDSQVRAAADKGMAQAAPVEIQRHETSV